jgi:hypothetical protein
MTKGQITSLALAVFILLLLCPWTKPIADIIYAISLFVTIFLLGATFANESKTQKRQIERVNNEAPPHIHQ